RQGADTLLLDCRPKISTRREQSIRGVCLRDSSQWPFAPTGLRASAERREPMTYRKLSVGRVAFRLMAALVVFAVASESRASDCGVETCRYVRQGATGSGSGADWSNACTDFVGSCASSSLIRGATYYVADGNYAARAWNTGTSGTSVIT